MEVWLVEEGQRTGPFSAYAIEGRISRGEVDESQPAWEPGMAQWGTLGEMPRFADAFLRVRAERAAEKRARRTPPPLPAAPLLLRRFFARWFDFNLVHLAWWGILAATGQDLVKIFANPWLLVAPLLPWGLIEAACLTRLATTPGKWLLGMEVRNMDGSRLGWRQALLRTLRVLTMGIGLRLPILVLVCQGVSAWLTKRFGAALWDLAPGHKVVWRPLDGVRVAALTVIFMVVVPATSMLLMPAMVELYGDQFPWLRAAAAQQP